MNNECEHCGEDCEGRYCVDCWDALDSEQERGCDSCWDPDECDLCTEGGENDG